MERRPQVTADQAADLLGVRLQTVYAYVSRGLLTRTHGLNEAGHRVSHFVLDEVLRLAAERTRVRTGSLEVLVESDVTLLDPKGSLSLRGHDAVALTERPFEDAAELLWSSDGVLRDHDPALWTLATGPRAAAERVAAALPDGVTDLDRVRAAVVALAGLDGERGVLSRAHVAAVGRTVLIGALAVIPLRQKDVGAGAFEMGLWPRLSDRPAAPAALEALRAALVLLVDHELAASTMAVRVAAGTGTDPYLMVLTGLGALGGPLHGRSSLDAEDLLTAVRAGGVEVLDRTEAYAGRRLPGFGHAVYVDADPRAEALLDRVARLDPEGWPAVEALLLAVSRRDGLSPNVDLALAALVQAAGLVPGAGETVFGLSRIVGWLAHGLEEAPQGLRFRGRAVYRGGVSGEVGDEV
ncbi:MAG: citrate/2-methylcitrate synthase, partial [Lapillicoccus sp.]